MVAKISCEKCKFSDKRILKWNMTHNPQKPYCTYPSKLAIDNNGDCQSGKV